MGKGDKKTKRGKIIIGSSGIKRTRKKKGSSPAGGTKSEPKNLKATGDEAALAAKNAPKKAAKKAEEHAEGADEKAKAAKAKKKASETEEVAEPASDEPKQE